MGKGPLYPHVPKSKSATVVVGQTYDKTAIVAVDEGNDNYKVLQIVSL